MVPPSCDWCGEPATCLMEVEPSRVSAKHTRRKSTVLARQLPACHACRARLLSRGHKQFPLMERGYSDWWAKRQGQLF